MLFYFFTRKLRVNMPVESKRTEPITADEKVARLIVNDVILGGYFDPDCSDHEIEALNAVLLQLQAKSLTGAIWETYFEGGGFDQFRIDNLIGMTGQFYIADPQILIPEIAKQLTEFLAFPQDMQRSLAVEIKQAKEIEVARLTK